MSSAHSKSLSITWSLMLLSVSLHTPLHAEPRVLIETFSLPSPTLPSVCAQSDLEASESVVWLVFSSLGCAPCKRWLRTLYQHRETLEAHAIRIVHVPTHARSCHAAYRIGRAYPDLPLGVLNPRALQRWSVQSTPSTYVLYKGSVRARLQGDAEWNPMFLQLHTSAPRKTKSPAK